MTRAERARLVVSRGFPDLPEVLMLTSRQRQTTTLRVLSCEVSPFVGPSVLRASGCGMCAGKWHIDHCELVTCAKKKGLESCVDYDDLPCTQLIQFTVDPTWRTHSPCIENLRRRRKIGTGAWLREQEEFWKDKTNRKAWLELHAECSRKSREGRK